MLNSGSKNNNGGSNNCSSGSTGAAGGSSSSGDRRERERERGRGHGRSSRDREDGGNNTNLGNPSSSSSNSGAPCGACKFLRRKCVNECVFAPYFGSDQGAARFAAVHKVFGASNVSKLLMHHVPPHKRHEAVLTICLEAQARISDPIHGCVSTIYALQQQVAALQAELAMVQAQLMNSRLAAANALQHQHHHHHHQQQQQQQIGMGIGMGMGMFQPANPNAVTVPQQQHIYGGHQEMHSNNPSACSSSTSSLRIMGVPSYGRLQLKDTAEASTEASNFAGMACDMDLSGGVPVGIGVSSMEDMAAASHHSNIVQTATATATADDEDADDPPPAPSDDVGEFQAFAHSLFHHRK